MFFEAKSFNQPILWDVSKVINIYCIFYKAKAFQDRFNNGNQLPEETNELKEWLINNRDRMIALNINNNDRKELDYYYINILNENNLKLNKE